MPSWLWLELVAWSGDWKILKSKKSQRNVVIYMQLEPLMIQESGDVHSDHSYIDSTNKPTSNT